MSDQSRPDTAPALPRYENLQPSDADRLADLLDQCDHIVTKWSANDTDDPMVEKVLDADANNFIVFVLRSYARGNSQ